MLGDGVKRKVWLPLRVLRTTSYAGLLLALVGCAASADVSPPTTMIIQHLGEVDGRWEGTVHAVEATETAHVIAVLADHGTYATYTFAATGEMDPVFGAGRLALRDGRLVSEAGDRALIFNLAERKGTRVLTVRGTGQDGRSYAGELGRAR